MKPVKSYEQFVTELRESRKLDEGVLDTIKSAVKKIGEWFKGIGASIYNALVEQNKGTLKGVKIFPTQVDINVMKAQGIDVKIPSVNESISPEELEMLNEKAITLEHPHPDVVNVGKKELELFLRTKVNAQKKWEKGDKKVTPLLIWGAPGIGKTSIIEEVAKLFWGPNAMDERRIIDFALSVKSPEDFSTPFISGKDELGNPTIQSKSEAIPAAGLPVYKFGDTRKYADKNGNEITPDDYANMKVTDTDGNVTEGGIIFLDEITNASERTQKACFSLINERRIGDYSIGSKWVILAAANRKTDDSTTFQWSDRVGNRLMQVNYCPKFEDWAEWARESTKGGFRILPEVLAYLMFHHEQNADSPEKPYGNWYYYDPDKLANDESSPIFPSPRSWEAASNTIEELREETKGKVNDKMLEIAISSNVGKTAAKDYMAFLEMSRKVNVSDIDNVYTNPKKAPTLKGLTVADKNAIITTIVTSKARKSFSKSEQENFMDWLIIITTTDKGNQAFALKAMKLMESYHKELIEDEYWIYDLTGKFFEANPGLTKEK